MTVDARESGAWSAEYLAAIVDSSDDAIIGKTLDGEIISWNKGAERLYGYTAAEVVGRPISILIPADRPDELPEILRRLRRGERVDHFRTERVRKDGVRLKVSVTISPVQDAEGRIIGASAIARDVTAQDQAVREALELREQFVSIAAHELRTPLAAIFARIQLIERRLGRQEYDRDTLARDIGIVRRGTDRLRLLLERLLDVSRIKSGRLEIERAPTDVVALARAAASEYAEASGHDVTVDASGAEGVMANIDGIRIEEVLVNLIDNAAKYGPANEPVAVRISTDANAVRIAVHDDGAGVPAHERERIFEAFYRANADTRGVGLGLHLAGEIVKLHGGTLVLEESDGRGTTFVVTLPR